jgi:hypothetical protein
MKTTFRMGALILALSLLVIATPRTASAALAVADSQPAAHSVIADDLREVVADVYSRGTVPVIVTYRSAPNATDLGRRPRPGRSPRP